MALPSAYELGEGAPTPSRRDGDGPPPDKNVDAGAVDVERKWKEAGDALSRQRRDYWLNLAFFEGEQWIWWDRRRNTVQTLPQQWSPLGPGRARLTVNRIEPNTVSLLGRLLKSELAFSVPPSDSADDQVLGAQKSEKVLEAYHREQDWESLRYDEIFACLMGGTSAVAVEWDASAGRQLEYDPATDQVTSVGELTLQAFNVNEFAIEPYHRDYREARWWISGLALPPAYVQEHYGLSWLPKADAGATLSPLQHKLLESSGRAHGRHLTQVLTYYERPHGKRKGVYRCVANGRTLHEGPWPFPFERLNLAVFRQRKISGRWHGGTLMNAAVPIQFAYNHARSVIAEHMKLTGNARMMAPFGAFAEEDFYDDPASILWYSPDVQGAEPKYMQPPELSRWVQNEAANLKSELDDLMHVHATSRGEGFDRASGQALALLSEKDDTPLSLMAREQKRGWSDIATMVLQILERKGVETRTQRINLAPGITETVRWNGQMLRGQTTATVDLDSVTPHTHAARLAFAKDLWDRKIITDPRRYAKMAGLPPDEFAELLDPDAARANRENLRMAQGLVELPEHFDNHGTHIAEHNRWRKSDAYKYADPDVRSIFDDHIQWHEVMEHEEFGRQMHRAMQNPALARLPQAHAPTGSDVPLTAEEQQALMAQEAMSNGGGQLQLPQGAGGGEGAPAPAMTEATPA